MFALRQCGNEALLVCATCNRPACGDHTAQTTPPECADCAARRREQQEQREAAQHGAVRRRWDEDDYWATNYRFHLWSTMHETRYDEHTHDEDDRGEVGDSVSDVGASGETGDDLFGGGGGDDDFDDGDFGGGDDGGDFGDS